MVVDGAVVDGDLAVVGAPAERVLHPLVVQPLCNKAPKHSRCQAFARPSCNMPKRSKKQAMVVLQQKKAGTAGLADGAHR